MDFLTNCDAFESVFWSAWRNSNIGHRVSSSLSCPWFNRNARPVSPGQVKVTTLENHEDRPNGGRLSCLFLNLADRSTFSALIAAYRCGEHFV